MSTERFKQLLGSETSVTASTSNTYLGINISAKEKLLPPDALTNIVSAGAQFNTERQASTYYRLLGTIKPIISNVLFNVNDPTNSDLYTWAGFNYRDQVTGNYTFLDTSYPRNQDVGDLTDLTYAQSIQSFLKEVEGWFGYFNPNILTSGLCNYFDMEPARNRFSFTPDISPYHCSTCNPVDNWQLSITYPSGMDTGHTLVNGGLFIFDCLPAIVSTRPMVAFGTPVLHNLNVGDTVLISGTTIYNGSYTVVRTGLDDGTLTGYYFVIDQVFALSSISNNSRMTRVYGGQPSQYYFRLFTKIPTRDGTIVNRSDYETYNVAFSQNIYFDAVSQFVFNADMNVSGLTDNLGRPLSQLYLTTIKTDSNGLFGKVSSGFETPFMPELNNSNTLPYLLDVPVIHKIHNGGSLPFPSHIPLEKNVTITNNNNIVNNNTFYGDVVDYNAYQVQETTLATISHRFNTINRETTGLTLNYVSQVGVFTNPTDRDPNGRATGLTQTTSLGPRQEGYYYQAHQLIQIREYSSYVEQGDLSSDIIPFYAVNLGDGRYLWRELLDIGFNESDLAPLNYPFLNGCHYLHQNYCFFVRRQDPFSNWNLYYSVFPADPIGDTITTQFVNNINTNTNVC